MQSKKSRPENSAHAASSGKRGVGKQLKSRRSEHMNLRELCQTLERELSKLFEELRSGIAAREDSRAFGAMIEHRITQSWRAICSRCGFTPVDLPGRRTIFDFGFSVTGEFDFHQANS